MTHVIRAILLATFLLAAQMSSVRGAEPKVSKPGGYAGYTSGTQPGTHVTQWTDAMPEGFATYHDEPGAQIPNTAWDFETAVVAKAGADEGVVYASCSWGFTVDDQLQPTPKPSKIEDKPSKDFYAAADKWNQQALGPQAGRNAPAQEALPTLR